MAHPARRLPADRYLSAALDYADAGIPVFLLGRTKRPVANCRGCPKGAPGHDPEACVCLTCHGFYAATRDPARVRAMFDAIPDGLLAIRTGAASERVVVDIDPRNGGRLDRALMAPTATVATGGGGWDHQVQVASVTTETVTPAGFRHCRCGTRLPPRPATGRWPRYCSQACRQAAYRARTVQKGHVQ